MGWITGNGEWRMGYGSMGNSEQGTENGKWGAWETMSKEKGMGNGEHWKQ